MLKLNLLVLDCLEGEAHFAAFGGIGETPSTGQLRVSQDLAKFFDSLECRFAASKRLVVYRLSHSLTFYESFFRCAVSGRCRRDDSNDGLSVIPPGFTVTQPHLGDGGALIVGEIGR